ncbi:MAG: peptidylprolyl isomerase [Prevotella sp.]|nr:peptidylprolyl isomerase [Prevotella sp.]
MNQKLHYFVFMLLCSLSLGTKAQSNDTIRHEVLLETSMGNIRLVLYNETPLHRDNFLRLVKDGYYDGNLFHRVISNFMIQSGDSTSRHAKPGSSVGEYSPDYTIPAEIVYPKYFHKRGALAAAREGDEENPQRASSSSQFYIVYGTNHSDADLDRFQELLDEATLGKTKMTKEIRTHYRKYGGTPHLDGQYTVFGEVIEGMDVVKKINRVFTDDYDRPVDDVRIVKATVVR